MKEPLKNLTEKPTANFEDFKIKLQLLLTDIGGDWYLFVATRTIMNFCLAAERRLGPRVSKRWWKQYRVDVEGMHNRRRGGSIHMGRRRRQTKLVGG